MNTETEVQEFIASNKVTVFSKSTCGFSAKAKSILSENLENNKDMSVMELNELNDEKRAFEIQEYLFKITGLSTVPQVFIHSQFIGGCQQILELHEDQELKTLIEDDG